MPHTFGPPTDQLIYRRAIAQLKVEQLQRRAWQRIEAGLRAQLAREGEPAEDQRVTGPDPRD